MRTDRNKIIGMVAILAFICVIVSALTRVSKQHSQTLEDYAKQNPDIAYRDAQYQDTQYQEKQEENTDAASYSALPGASLNSAVPAKERTTYTKGFYYEPLSENLQRYITGISYPPVSLQKEPFSSDETSVQNPADSQEQITARDMPVPDVAYEDLRYVHIWHYDFSGNPVEGELICNQEIAQDLVEIFYELYRNEYRIAQVHLIDEYDGDNYASMENNNSFCFNDDYNISGEDSALFQHSCGLAVDINPMYNPYITYNEDNSPQISPSSAQPYADRSGSFPYKIDENDLCYQLFKDHGFIWGGNFNSCKDYQHFHRAQ